MSKTNPAKGITDEKSIVKSLFKALSLLECFSPESPELSVAELSERTGVQKATCNRLVITMMHAGWLERVARGRYAPTVKLFRLGSTAVGRLDIRASARPYLVELAERFGDGVYLMVPDGKQVVCLDRLEGSKPLQVRAIDIGMSMPLHAGGAPMALLAHREDLRAEVASQDREAFTDETITDLDDLDRALEEVRERGYAFSSEDLLPGVAAIGAPVFDNEGIAIGALSLGGDAARFQGSAAREIAEAVRAAAESLSTQFGHDT